METLTTDFKIVLRDVGRFAAHTSGTRLRRYQLAVARAICDSVTHNKGYTFVVVFPRQSGKNELQAQIETYLLTLFSSMEAEIVKVSPTWKPQSLNAMRRLERALSRSMTAGQPWKKEAGYIYKVGRARIYFLSGSPTSNVVGATANTLLECDEAQDVLISKWDKEFNPMAASANATRVFWGTAWTSQTLLAREMRAARAAEKQDGVRRVFQAAAAEVIAEVPAYGQFLQGEIAKLGRDHPFVKTQYFSQEIDAEGGMFPTHRLQLMLGQHERLLGPRPGEIYAFLLDVAGESESAAQFTQYTFLPDLKRDSTALTIVRADLSEFAALRAPRYQVVERRLWTGVRHTQLFGQIVALAQAWRPRWLVCDSTGVGAGLASFLAKSLGEGRVLPFVFSQSSKSKLGWDFLSIIETGRFQDHRSEDGSPPQAATGLTATAQEVFWLQLTHTQIEILPGPGQIMRWSVPDGARDPVSGEPIHDDLVVSAALCAVLEEQPWGLAESIVVRGVDPLEGLGEVW